MNQANGDQARVGSVEARMTYSIDTGVKPVSATFVPGGRATQTVGEFEEHLVTIRNGRPHRDRLSLDVQGFVFIDHKTQVRDFYDTDEVLAVYYPEVEQLVKDLTGATRVLVFDHTIRTGDEANQEAKRLREPVKAVHNDYTEWSGPQRLRDLVPAEEAQALLKHRLAVIQIWRPIRGPVESAPLAICDARSVHSRDLIAAERRHPDRVGEIYQVAFNPAHQWMYFPHMQRDEALVFKCYDSVKDGRARFTAHASFDDPSAPSDASPRESIEARTLTMFV